MEVYGVKPKKFTKAWWEYFWYYYKWHTVCGLVAACLIGTSCVQCATQTKYDLQVDFIAERNLAEENSVAIRSMAEGIVDDVTGNGKNDVFILTLDMSENSDPQIMQAMQTKMTLEMGYSEGYTFIMSKKYADIMVENDALERADVWAGEDVEGYAISLAESRVLNEIGLDTADLYVGVVKMKDDKKDDDKECAKYNNGVKFAQYLLGRE